MSINVFSNIGGIIESSVIEPASKIAESLSGNLIPFVGGGLTLWVMVYALAVVRGAVHTPISDFTWRVTKISLIIFFGIGGGIFQSDVYRFYNEISNTIFNAVSLGGGGSCPISANDPMGIYSALDCATGKMLDPLIDNSNKIKDLISPPDATWYEILSNAVSAIVPLLLFEIMFVLSFIASIVLVVYMGFEVISIRVTLALALALSPIFIFSLAFEPIKNLFSNWLNVVIKSIIFQAIFIVFMGVAFKAVTNLIGTMFDGAIQNDLISSLMFSSMSFVSFIIMMLIFIFVASRLPALAAELSSGGANGAGLGTLLTGMATKGLWKATGGKLGSQPKPGGSITT
jgi:type IV secretion system protein VirB6